MPPSSSTRRPLLMTKSLFQTALQCPRRAWYAWQKYPDDKNDNAFLQDLAQQGYTVGRYGQALYQSLGDNNRNDGNNSPCLNMAPRAFETNQQAVERTARRLLEFQQDYDNNNNNSTAKSTTKSSSQSVSSVLTLLEASFQTGPFFIRTDILQLDPAARTVRLVEVKAKSWDSKAASAAGYENDPNENDDFPLANPALTREAFFGKRKSWGEDDEKKIKASSPYFTHLYDVAFQKYVLQRALYEMTTMNEESITKTTTEPTSFPFANHTISSYLLLPDKAKRHDDEQRPNLNQELGVEDEANQFVADDNPQQLWKGHSFLLTHVGTDEAVSAIWQQPLPWPQVQVYYNDDDDMKDTRTFVQVLDEWADSHGSNTLNSMESELGRTPAPIGKQCSSCEYRLKNRPRDNSRSVEQQQEDPSSKTPSELSGFEECWRQTTRQEDITDDDALVPDLYYGTAKVVQKCMGEERYHLAEMTRRDLGLDKKKTKKKTTTSKPKKPGWTRAERQWLHVDLDADGNDNNTMPTVELETDVLRQHLAEWPQPWHLIDFETITPALPFSVGKRPYDILAFEFSHHVIRHNDNAPAEHATEFLHAQPGQCPNGHFLQALRDALCKDTGEIQGTVFRWGSHENTVLSAVLREQGRHYPELVEQLGPLLVGQEQAMVDLMDVSTRCYYVQGCHGSSSIKKLLQPTLQASSVLKGMYGSPTYSSRNFTNMQWWQQTYNENEEESSTSAFVADPYALLAVQHDSGSATEAAQHGGDAIMAYRMLQQSDLEVLHRRALEASLKRYCELDTLAMAMILQAWQGFLGESC